MMKTADEMLDYLQGLIDGAGEHNVIINGFALVVISVNNEVIGIGDTLREAIRDASERHAA
jgi:hypothetical protein